MVLWNIYNFIRVILKGRETDRYDPQTPLSPQPILLKSCLEQIEDEGGNEEIEAQLVNKGYIIKDHANDAKRYILNIYVDNSNPRPWQYN
ncbi:MAG: hypothetical protein EZS28_041172 [Streblomastix strix]|uniref:Uncharacterized protein n=1 Tax=Streblomastix strix TaxID=222440 RepID=A0A5J4U014_9EUKA|nr:MAG: hypothetical protein EZS28_041172 [Streblomastix strix]